jgi:hypothetical protein
MNFSVVSNLVSIFWTLFFYIQNDMLKQILLCVILTDFYPNFILKHLIVPYFGYYSRNCLITF